MWTTTDTQRCLTAAINNTDGAITRTYYKPYGQIRAGAPINERGFLHQHNDPTITLNYLNNRYMDPSTGVFISVDPLVGRPGMAYLYGGGNPTTLSDPSGLHPCEAINPSPGVCPAFLKENEPHSFQAAVTRLKKLTQNPAVTPEAVTGYAAVCEYWYAQCSGTKNPNYLDSWRDLSPDEQAAAVANFEAAKLMYLLLRATGLATLNGNGTLTLAGDGTLAAAIGWDSAGSISIGLTPKDTGPEWSAGIGGGFCIFICIPEIGLSSEGPYIRPGVGVAIDSPGIVWGGAPECGSEQSIAYASVSLYFAQVSGGATSSGRSGDWDGFLAPSIGLPDGGATPHYRAASVGAGVVHQWTMC